MRKERVEAKATTFLEYALACFKVDQQGDIKKIKRRC
jgi:hypothetical protein